MTARSSLRRRLRRARRDLPTGLRHQANAQIHRLILQHPRYRQARRIALYFAAGGEVNVAATVAHAQASGKRVLMPRVHGKRLLFVPWHHGARAVPGRYGIARPAAHFEPVPARHIDLVIAPLVGFSPGGARLGQGGGYYDRALACRLHSQWRRPYFLGVAFGLQWIGKLKTEPWDVGMDCVLHDSITTGNPCT